LDAGVNKIILPNIDSSSVTRMLELSERYPDICFPLMGLHPTSVKENYSEELKKLRAILAERKFYGIGEIGIDLYWDKTFIEEQQDAFRQQVRLAKQLALPVVIHVRDSFDEVYKIIAGEQDGNLTGIFHCFTGTIGQAEKVIGAGFKLGIGGVVTFKNSNLREVLAQVDVKHLVLETDSPYLAPAPFRGKRNESSYLLNIAREVAGIYQLPLSEVAEITTENVVNLFGI